MHTKFTDACEMQSLACLIQSQRRVTVTQIDNEVNVTDYTMQDNVP